MLDVDITRRAGAFTLDVTLAASSGVTAVFGPSGAGKTTLARCIAGLERPDSGRVALGGEVMFGPDRDLPPHLRGIGYVFQEPRLFPHLDVTANLLYGARPGTDPGPVAEMLDIGPLLGRRPGGLSGGEAARVAIGRALLRSPRLLILDEPLASLDRRRRAAILPYLERLRDSGTPILYISHAIEEVARLATTLVLLQDGRVAASGSVGDLLSDPDVAARLGPDQAGALIEGRITAQEGGLATVETPLGQLEVAGVDGPPGGRVRVRIRAEDVIVARMRPEGLSARNVLPCRIATLRAGQGPGVMLRLEAGDGRLLARLTRRSVEEMGLAEGQTVWAVVKTSGVARMDVGR
ncbi:molybdenum ABC transporter ATP-binding protein [Jannaschia seohaensis]|uniref:Molybdate transport system ATP-binding protein n=1 Tax=Jannaschia seohaensis TaxID=475081 RepID=A0A2Y9AP40_9RHOB|nr:molybdenum ABC transporter ATP-binding protein [Jannaschia seohaensis]PWJ19243.1 molybdate transport system ATP-binding protein [Jannaschia seohaensis]SSA45905.1 molybdate transport system ATP-binding protein [Jannaschia seohaensis]